MAGLNIWSGFSMVFFLQGLLVNATSANADEERIVLVSTSSRIYISRGPEFDFNQLPFSVGTPGGIDFDTEIGMLFWTDTTGNAIKRAELEDANWTHVISTGRSPAGIAVDGDEELLFWIHTKINKRSIERVTYDGRERTELVEKRSYTYNMNSITLDRKTRTLYWTEGSSIQTSTYEGLNKRTLVSTNSYPLGLALNMDQSMLSWCESNSVKTLHTSGGGTATTSERLSSTCSGIAWFEGDAYWIYGTRFLSVKDEETDIVSQVPISPSSLATNDLFVGRIPVQGLHGGECDFERIKCKWGFKNLMSNGLNWSRRSAEQAANSSIGPTVDHTTQSRIGHYLLLNTSIQAGSIATIISPPVNVTGTTETQCLRFWYYMHDVINGSLAVFFKHENQTETKSSSGEPSDELNPLWSAYGSQPDEWVGAEVEVRATGVGRILIKAIVGDPSSNIIAIDDVHFGKCRQDSRLVCEESSMTVYLDKARLGISSQDGVSFKNSLCRGVDHDSDTVAITAPYNACGTTVSESDDNILFSNQVNVMIHSDIRSSDVSIRVNCSLSRTYHVAMTYLAHAWIRYIRKDGYGNFSVGIRQYINVKFEDAYPSDVFPQQVEIDERIYMATEMVTIKSVVDTLHNKRCWATPSRDPSDPLSRDIIEDGCPIDASTKVYTLLTRGMQAFSFKAFSFSQDKNLIYVHCDIIVCHESKESGCSANCSHSRPVRETRDTRDAGSGPYTVSRGPFIYKTAASRQEGVTSLNIILLSALVCMTVLLLATIFVGIIIYARSRNGIRRN